MSGAWSVELFGFTVTGSDVASEPSGNWSITSGINGSSALCSWPLYFMSMVKVAVFLAAPKVLALPVFGGSNCLRRGTCRVHMLAVMRVYQLGR